MRAEGLRVSPRVWSPSHPCRALQNQSMIDARREPEQPARLDQTFASDREVRASPSAASYAKQHDIK